MEDEYNRKLSTKGQQHLNQVDQMNKEFAAQKKASDDAHQAELRNLDKEKAVRASEVV